MRRSSAAPLFAPSLSVLKFKQTRTSLKSFARPHVLHTTRVRRSPFPTGLQARNQPKMLKLITAIPSRLHQLASSILVFLMFRPPLRGLLLPFLGRPEGIRGALLARFIFPALNRSTQDSIVVVADPPEDARVLELGFAKGDLLQSLIDRGVKPPVYGLDIMRDMVALCRSKLGKHAVLGSANIEEEGLVAPGLTYGQLFEAEDCERAGFSASEVVAPFDQVIMTNVFYFFSDEGIYHAAKNLWALLRDGGKVLTVSSPVEDYSEGFQAMGFEGDMSSARYMDAMQAAGFKTHKEEDANGETTTLVSVKCQE
ncbi:unnamed protein product [Chondrus crispus]|uniref:Methyltransferase type 11 domain-containing protein n=1 Tax=Chondrus crispus TaxID=2769 RepID=R7QMT0_CHOCR|nr:unnamed protein product [Chondrus crispus]CDF39058.1 unnamed protein product [Chondrus crispus]|eukprot:XP_005718969.1 unnamed protein product [Chondrus crispus]